MEQSKNQHGGARSGAGRKPGHSSKKLREQFFENLTLQQEVAELNDMWQHFKLVARDKATQGDTQDYQWIFSRLMPVPKEQEIDVTSDGEKVSSHPIINVMAKEIPDFINVKSG